MQKEKFKKSLFYVLLVFFVLTFLTLLIREVPFLNNFSQSMEKKSFDVRENILAGINAKSRFDNSKVALIVIDDVSLTKLSDKYGFWPWNRQAYADILKYLENDGADTVFYDFMFLGFQQGNEAKDWNFINEVKNHDNVYISMNFDYENYNDNFDLPLKYVANLDNKSTDINFNDFHFTGIRKMLPELFNVTPHVAFINFQRDGDGISRRVPSFFIYKEKYYPYASVQIAQDYLYKHKIIDTKKYIIDANNYLLMGNKKIKLDKEGYIILNWHNKSMVDAIPLWKVLNGEVEKGYFKDKIVAIGASAVSMYDVKSTPLEKSMPGVYFHTTCINNILNSNTIMPVDFKYNLLIAFMIVLITSILLFKIDSNVINAFVASGAICLYFSVATIALANYNILIDLAYPIFLILMVYTIVYVVKFMKKSQDFEKTYKLATTDGLTELYNHRYFQEQMIAQIDTAKRYKGNFSLIMIDIDFFKKFNDKYGHQVGDDVLRRIAGMLKKSVRVSDIVARYGGEEMAIILPNTSVEDAVITANKICHAVNEKPFKLIGGIETAITISLGVSTYPMHGETAQELIEAADKGLYNAKENGRNQVGQVQPFKGEE